MNIQRLKDRDNKGKFITPLQYSIWNISNHHWIIEEGKTDLKANLAGTGIDLNVGDDKSVPKSAFDVFNNDDGGKLTLLDLKLPNL